MWGIRGRAAASNRSAPTPQARSSRRRGARATDRHRHLEVSAALGRFICVPAPALELAASGTLGTLVKPRSRPLQAFGMCATCDGELGRDSTPAGRSARCALNPGLARPELLPSSDAGHPTTRSQIALRAASGQRRVATRPLAAGLAPRRAGSSIGRPSGGRGRGAALAV